MISGDYTRERIEVSVGATALEPETVTFEIRRGGQEFGPYRGGPEVGTATINLYYAPGAYVPVVNFVVGSRVEFSLVSTGGSLYGYLFTGHLQDYSIDYVLDEATNTFGQTVTLYACDLVGYLQRVNIPGMVTSRTTKNVSWETRMNTLSASIPLSGGFALPTSPESHIFRLVDNNLDAPLTEHLNLACNSVGATWYVNNTNSVQPLKKGEYPTTGILFTDQPGYWTTGNKPVKAGSIIGYNVEYQRVDAGSDTGNLVNTIDLTNIIPRNMQTRATTGALLYKDPATVPGPRLPVLEQVYRAQDATSVSTYGARTRELLTNVYPYRTTDAEAYYVDWNTCIDPGCEYQNVRLTDTSNIRCDLTFSTTTPYAGTHSGAVTQTVVDTSVGFYIGPTEGYAFKVRPTVATNFYRMRVRATNANTLVTPQVEWLDSNGASLAIQNSAFTNLTNGVWTQIVCTFVPGTIPARAVAFRPRVVFGSISGATHPVGTIFRIDAISVNQGFDAAAEFSGDTPDTSTILYAWEGDPGDSFSYRTNNILDNLGAEVLTYWKEQKNKIRSLTFNARQNWETVLGLEPGARVDVRFAGANYTAWISSIRYRANNEDCMITLNLSNRPTSWI
jgi:hypothetical protein